MFITREADYAVRCVLLLASRTDREKWSVREMAAELGLSQGFLAKILQRLGRVGIVAAGRGAQGGYCLARLPAEISLLQVIQAIQGPSAANRCAVEPESCSSSPICPVHPVWVELRREIEARLTRETFALLAQRLVVPVSEPSDEEALPSPETCQRS